MKRLLKIVIVLLLVAQIFQPDRSTPITEPGADLITMTSAASEVANALRVACYDCHSNTTNYPWYCYITPVNYWLQNHVNEGREELNMSEWGAHNEKWKRHKAKEAVEMLEEGTMPPDNYTWLHGEAELTQAQRAALVLYFRGLRNAPDAPPAVPPS